MTLLTESPLFKKINGFSPERRQKIINDQGIHGLFDNEEVFKRQRLANFHKHETALIVGRHFDEINLEHAFIKGVSFLEQIYPQFGQRFMSDIDLLIGKGVDKKIVHRCLESLDFTMRNSRSWLGNRHKEEWVHNKDKIVLEIHYDFFWHCTVSEGLAIRSLESGLKILKPELHFTYLCGHYAFQHTCQKLYWLIDFKFFLDFHNDDFDWGEVCYWSEKLKVKKSVSFTCKVLKHAFDLETPISKSSTSLPFNEELLFDDSVTSYYLFLKFSLKDNLYDNIRYNIAWLKNLLR